MCPRSMTAVEQRFRPRMQSPQPLHRSVKFSGNPNKGRYYRIPLEAYGLLLNQILRLLVSWCDRAGCMSCSSRGLIVIDRFGSDLSLGAYWTCLVRETLALHGNSTMLLFTS